MATTDYTVDFDVAFVKKLYSHLPGKLKNCDESSLINLAKSGLIQRDRMFEVVMAHLSNGKYVVESVKEKCSESALINLSELGMVQRDRMFEVVMAHLSNGKYVVESNDGWDWSNKDEGKTATTNRRASLNYRNVIITNIKNKTGNIRAMVYDQPSDSFAYYYIFNYESVRAYNRLEFTWNSNSKYSNGDCGLRVADLVSLARI